MHLSDQDFKDYYTEPAEFFACREDWEAHCLFPREAATSEKGKRKALNALYRFLLSGIAEFAFVPMMEGLNDLEKAPLEPIGENYNVEQFDQYADIWMGTLVIGTPYFIKELAPKMGVLLEMDVPPPPEFRNNLNALFQKHGVGFEKGDVYPPFLQNK